MFSIYSTEGRYLRSTMEELRRVRELPASKPLSPLGEDTGMQPAEPAGRSMREAVTPEGIRTYRDTLSVPEREAIVHAYQVMSHPVETVPSTLELADVLRLLRETGYQQLPVLDEKHRLVGLLSERDLMKCLDLDGNALSFLQGRAVADVMSAEVITADPVTDVRRVARVMLDYRLSAMPVVDERDTLVGIVSRSDILRGVSNDPPLSLWT